jgi:hypothetical protein
MDVLYRCTGIGDKPLGIVFFIRIGNIDQMMRDDIPLLICGLGRTDIHKTVHLHGIHTDYFAVKGPGQFQRKSGFSYGRRTNKHQDRL